MRCARAAPLARGPGHGGIVAWAGGVRRQRLCGRDWQSTGRTRPEPRSSNHGGGLVGCSLVQGRRLRCKGHRGFTSGQGGCFAILKLLGSVAVWAGCTSGTESPRYCWGRLQWAGRRVGGRHGRRGLWLRVLQTGQGQSPVRWPWRLGSKGAQLKG